MGNSLSHDSQGVLEAASAGDAGRLKQQIAGEPRLLQSVTLVKRRSVLHLAAKCGHPEVISAVLEPLLAAVRQEYYVSWAGVSCVCGGGGGGARWCACGPMLCPDARCACV
jgi:hypothetical protein